MRGGGLAIINHNLSIIHSFHCPFIQHLNVLVLLSHYPPFRLKFLQFIDLHHHQSFFCAEFESLLEHRITSNIDLIFVDDFNIHIDKLDDPNTVLFNRLLLNFNLNQHISFPTHDSGHILNLIITNASFKLAINLNLIETRISDRKTVYIDLDSLKPVV